MCVSVSAQQLNHARLLVNPGSSPWDFSGKDNRVGCHFLLQGIFPTQGSNPCLCVPCTGRFFTTVSLGRYCHIYQKMNTNVHSLYVKLMPVNSAICRLSIKNRVKPQGLTPEEMSDISQDGIHIHKLSSTGKNAWPSNSN